MESIQRATARWFLYHLVQKSSQYPVITSSCPNTFFTPNEIYLAFIFCGESPRDTVVFLSVAAKSRNFILWAFFHSMGFFSFYGIFLPFYGIFFHSTEFLSPSPDQVGNSEISPCIKAALPTASLSSFLFPTHPIHLRSLLTPSILALFASLVSFDHPPSTNGF